MLGTSNEAFEGERVGENRSEARENELNRSTRTREMMRRAAEARAVEDARLLAPLQNIYSKLFRNQGVLLCSLLFTPVHMFIFHTSLYIVPVGVGGFSKALVVSLWKELCYPTYKHFEKFAIAFSNCGTCAHSKRSLFLRPSLHVHPLFHFPLLFSSDCKIPLR